MPFRAFAVAMAISTAIVSIGNAQNLSPEEQAAARTKVEVAVALAEMAEAEKDGDALLVAARLLSSVGPVAKRGEAAGDSPTVYSPQELAAAAKAMGADAAKADGVTSMSTPTSERNYCYWYYNCDSYNNCVWQYIC